MTLLSVENLNVEYRHGKRRIPAVRGVSFSIDAGTCLGIAGESGSGKSTVALALLKLLPDTAGLSADRLIFDGRSILDLDPNALRALRGGTLGIVFQDPFSALNPVLTVGDQVDEVIKIHGGRSNHTRVIELFERVRLPHPRDLFRAYPHQLSGGQRQRVCLAMAIASNPKLLVADEPTTALDVTVQRDILNLLDDLRRDLNMALLLVTHNVGLLSERANRLAVMYAGEIVEIGPTCTVLETPSHPYTQGLLKSLPRLSGADRRLPALPGQPPDPSHLPSGCPFRVRCSSAFDRCAVESPALRAVRDAPVFAGCHLYGANA